MSNTFYKPKNEFGELLASKVDLAAAVVDLSAKDTELDNKIKNNKTIKICNINEDGIGSFTTIGAYFKEVRVKIADETYKLTWDEFKVRLGQTIWLVPGEDVTDTTNYEEYICIDPENVSIDPDTEIEVTRLGAVDSILAKHNEVGSSKLATDLYNLTEEEWKQYYYVNTEMGKEVRYPAKGIATAPYALKQFVERDINLANDISNLHSYTEGEVERIDGNIKSILDELGGEIGDITEEGEIQNSRLDKVYEIIGLDGCDCTSTSCGCNPSCGCDPEEVLDGCSIICKLKCLEDNISENYNSIANNNNDISVLKTQMEDATVAITNNHSAISSINLSLEGIEENIVKIKSDISDNAVKIDKNSSNISKLDDRVKQIETNDIPNINTSIEGIKETIGSDHDRPDSRSIFELILANITAIANEVTDRKEAITNEVTARNAAITAESEARNTAIAAAIAAEIANRDTAITTAITAEITNRNAAIAKEVSDRKEAITDAIDTEITNRNNAISDAITDAIDTEVTNRNNAITDAITAESEARKEAITAESNARAAAITAALAEEIANRNDAINEKVLNILEEANAYTDSFYKSKNIILNATITPEESADPVNGYKISYTTIWDKIKPAIKGMSQSTMRLIVNSVILVDTDYPGKDESEGTYFEQVYPEIKYKGTYDANVGSESRAIHLYFGDSERHEINISLTVYDDTATDYKFYI